MGLDMFLKTNGKRVCKAAVRATGGSSWHKSSGIAIYWRKANAIHKWFVDNVQYGNDDCGTYGVEVEQLKELRKVCKKILNSTRLVKGKVFAGRHFEGDRLVDVFEDGMVLEDSSVAEELLPTQDGFFFGNTNYDEYYWSDLQHTVKGLDAILRNVEEFEYEPWENAEQKWKGWREKGETDDWEVRFYYHSSW